VPSNGASAVLGFRSVVVNDYSANGSCVAPVATSQRWPSGSAK
jgi:hypothetical protein